MPETTRRAAAAQDFNSIAQLFRQKVFRFVLASVRDRELAENLTQECLMRAYQGFGSFRGECRPDTWLLQIAINLIRDHSRNRRLQFWKRTQAHAARNIWDVLPDQSLSPEADVLRNERLQNIWKAAEQLSERQRTVFLLRFVEDMELLEISAATGLKEGTVKAHLFRAVQAIRGQMGVQT
jgi:RNA polymerase sigma-70 factor, ECF subfamily